MRPLVAFAGAAALLVVGLGAVAAEETDTGAGHGPSIPRQHWSWDGIFRSFNQAALQRGFQVYSEVCAACHGLDLVAYRNLSEIGFDEEQVKAIAAAAVITDGPNQEGEMFERPGLPSDHFKAPFANPQAARAANNGALPPDLSLMVKARLGGVDYLYALLTGYGEPPATVSLGDGMSYNPYFAAGAGQIAMPPPLSEGVVTYADGTVATVPQMAHDVATFLAWTAEPEMAQRKNIGISAMIFLVFFTGVLFALKKSVWSKLH